MQIGKIIILIGGLLTLFSTFFLAYFVYTGTIYGYGLGFIGNFEDIFNETELYAIAMDTEESTVIFLTIVLLFFIFSGFIQLAGIANRIIAVIGSILPIVVSITILSVCLSDLDTWKHLRLFIDEAILQDVLPINVELGDVSLGTYLTLTGGILGVAGGVLGSREFFNQE